MNTTLAVNTLLPPGKHPEPQAAAAPRPAAAVCIWPRDSAIEDFVGLARQFCEAEHSILTGAFLPVVAALFGRSVYINFGRRVFCNLFNILVAPAGLRMSTAIDFAAHIARSLLPKEAFIPGGFTSSQALFAEYLKYPNKLWLIDEGNVILANWARDPAGRGVALKILALYDSSLWTENYLRHERKESKAVQEVETTNTSILLNATPVDARFSELETRDGMRQRFCYYVSERFGRLIHWPPSYDNSRELSRLVAELGALKSLQGEMRLSREALELWRELQVKNRRQIEDSVNEIHGGLLSFSPAKILKLSMLFEICRWARDKRRDWQVISVDTLKIAAQHEAGCVQAGRRLDGTIIPFAPALFLSGEANIDAINRELDRIRQERHRHCEPDSGY